MKNHYLIKIILVLCFLPTTLTAKPLAVTSPKDVGMSAEVLSKIDISMQSYIDENRLGDIEVLIARKGKIVYNKSFSNDKSKNKNESLYRIASMTKPITSVAIMMLIEEGKLSLEDPVSRYITEFKDVKVLIDDSSADKEKYKLVDAERTITVKDLLTHTSGVIYKFLKVKHLSRMYHENGVSDGLDNSIGLIGDNVKKIAILPLKHQPGKRFTYGLSTDVLGYLVEVVSQKTLEQYFREKILAPLKMDDTHFYLSEKKSSRLVPLYTPDEKKGIRKIDEVKDKSNLVSRFKNTGKETYYSGGGGLVSSANNYARFLQMMINKGELDGVRILKSKTVELMFENHIKQVEQGDRNFRFGLGFMISNKPTAKEVIPEGSLSWGGIFHTKFWIDPSNDLIAVSMAQKFPAPKSDVHVQFKKLVYEALVD